MICVLELWTLGFFGVLGFIRIYFWSEFFRFFIKIFVKSWDFGVVFSITWDIVIFVNLFIYLKCWVLVMNWMGFGIFGIFYVCFSFFV